MSPNDVSDALVLAWNCLGYRDACLFEDTARITDWAGASTRPRVNDQQRAFVPDARPFPVAVV